MLSAGCLQKPYALRAPGQPALFKQAPHPHPYSSPPPAASVDHLLPHSATCSEYSRPPGPQAFLGVSAETDFQAPLIPRPRGSGLLCDWAMLPPTSARGQSECRSEEGPPSCRQPRSKFGAARGLPSTRGERQPAGLTTRLRTEPRAGGAGRRPGPGSPACSCSSDGQRGASAGRRPGCFHTGGPLPEVGGS